MHLCVEWDASHTFKKKDKKRDDYLMEHYKIPTLRFREMPKKEELDKIIIDFIEKWEASAEERKRVMWNY